MTFQARLPKVFAAVVAVSLMFSMFSMMNIQESRVQPEIMSSSSHRVPLIVQRKLPTLEKDSTFGLSEDGWTKDPICQKWEAFDKAVQTQKNFEGNCVPVESLLPNDFSIQLCTSKRFCGQGYFVVSRIDKVRCDKDLDIDVSNHKLYNQYVKDEFGPDLFHVVFDGPERASTSMWRHLGNCEYKIPFRLTNPGVYSVQLILAYEQFRALNELTDVWPQTNLSQLIPSTFTLDVCSKHCTPFTSKMVHSMHPSLPLCSRTEPTQGVYLKITGETARELRYMQGYNHKYIYEPLGCRFDQLFETHANDTCFSHRNYAFQLMGDSQARGLWFGLDARLAGSNTPVLEKIKWERAFAKYFNPADLEKYPALAKAIADDSERQGNSDEFDKDDIRTKLNGVTMDYTAPSHLEIFYNSDWIKSWDEKSGTRTEEYLAKYDALVMNSGHHPASGQWQGGHYTVQRYVFMLEYVATYMAEVQSRRSSHGYNPLEFVWMGTNAITLINDLTHRHVDWKDWRNNYRFRIWNEYSDEIFLRNGFKVINSYEMTLPWAQDSPDQSHMHTLPAMEAQADEVLHKLNLCNV
ncbi:hypothetical protein BCR33DRAFT_357837 [Rhizoclosmatium globosum]|uniref:Uncharacterized protein n=1 Tax=Rhizoclosmatium globosum TaxID=329046 RepID=A0A1Y2C134_9FUNG|nr:hypothetical protein BCR33DRAFT_357837 [Rhizoclosmatium globosum]|eukprot:ORY40738.1 hypothetical protein BCR33DRAFT_357837 [Rhizoclosmatium globosum]